MAKIKLGCNRISVEMERRWTLMISDSHSELTDLVVRYKCKRCVAGDFISSLFLDRVKPVNKV